MTGAMIGATWALWSGLVATGPGTDETPPIVEAAVASPVRKAGASHEKKKKKNDRIRIQIGKAQLRVGARLMTGWQYRDSRPVTAQGVNGGSRYGFFMQQARIKLGLDYGKHLELRVSADLADAFDTPSVDKLPYLRSAYANIRFVDAMQVQVGHFKRPFSALELRGVGRLPFRSRGLANGRIVEDRNFGDRALGAMVWGKIDAARLHWYAGAFNAALDGKGADAVGRVTIEPIKWLSVGGSGGYKRIEDGTGQMVGASSASADVGLHLGGLRILVDTVAGQDYLVPGRPWAMGVVGYASYDLDLPRGFVLQSVMLAEWADANTRVLQSEAMRLLLGLNLNWKKSRVRVMPQAEFIRPLGVVSGLSPWVERDTYYVVLSVEI